MAKYSKVCLFDKESKSLWLWPKWKFWCQGKVALLQCFNAGKNRVAPYQSYNKYTITNANDTVYATPIKKYTKQNTKNTNIILGCFVRGEIFVTYVLFGVFLTGLENALAYKNEWGMPTDNIIQFFSAGSFTRKFILNGGIYGAVSERTLSVLRKRQNYSQALTPDDTDDSLISSFGIEMQTTRSPAKDRAPSSWKPKFYFQDDLTVPNCFVVVFCPVSLELGVQHCDPPWCAPGLVPRGTRQSNCHPLNTIGSTVNPRFFC